MSMVINTHKKRKRGIRVVVDTKKRYFIYESKCVTESNGVGGVVEKNKCK